MSGGQITVQIIVPVLAALIGLIGGIRGGWVSGVRAAEVTVKAEQERQKLVLEQSLYDGVLEGLVLLHSKGFGALFLVEAEKGFIYGSVPVVKALAGSRKKLVDYLTAKKEAEDAEKTEKDWENAKAKEAKALEDWDNARIKLLYTMRKELQKSNTELDENWLKTEWPALGTKRAEVEKVLLLRQR